MKIKIQHKISKIKCISQSQFKGRIFVICKLELLKLIIILIADSFKSRIKVTCSFIESIYKLSLSSFNSLNFSRENFFITLYRSSLSLISEKSKHSIQVSKLEFENIKLLIKVFFHNNYIL